MSHLQFKVVSSPESTRGGQDLVESLDLYTLNEEGQLKVAERPTLSDLESELVAFNRSFYHVGEQQTISELGALSIL